MPQMGESIAEGTVAKWLKKVGDAVVRDEPLLEISTDKVDAEIPAPVAGMLVAINVAEGSTAEVLSVLAVIEDASAGVTEAPPATGPPAETAPVASSVLTSGSAPRRQLPSGLRVSPVALRIARDHDIDLTGVNGTGGAGRITKHDVLCRLSADGAAPIARPVSPARGSNVAPMTVMRRRISERMVASRRISAHVHSVFEVDCSRIEATRQARKAEFAAAGARLSFLPFVLKAAASALREFPILNSSLDGDKVVYHGDINVGVAVALDAGLIVPVIRQADRRTLLEISLAIGDLADRARSKQLAPEDVAGGTFTVTNPGNHGGAFATPIINQPQVAILELGTVEKRVAVVNDDLGIRSVMNLTLGFDHRLIDGAVADQYLSSVTHALEHWNDGS